MSIRFSLSQKAAQLVGLQVPWIVGFGIDLCILGAGTLFGPNIADYLGPFDWPETFQASVRDDGLVIEKFRTQEEGFAEVWFCQRGQGRRIIMTQVHSGLFSEREETLRLRGGEITYLDEDKPLLVLTNLSVDGDEISFYELIDPTLGTRLARGDGGGSHRDCSWETVKEML
ncbi:hypothetical protein LR948_18170 [Roseivivax sp. GX 12232]|uniref:hypothetical protein n=1 Tax=Roseivivax sp. GX 12232 TaxID=2900547 RepID=UPI001E542F11|nr:hypothetical protein [Roseivivax sp. GX 12232]MCE0507294.1 hypothetical protein [Roseivivax sp. GX 12232]